MTKLQRIIAGSIATGALIVNSALPILANTYEISGATGADSTNEIEVTQAAVTTVTQDNHADIDNHINISANTGENTASKNTGGAVEVKTGDADVTTSISNTANVNSAELGCCGGQSVDTKIGGNGAESENEVELNLSKLTTISQDNNSDIYNGVEVTAKTGSNEAEENTNGNVLVETGDVTVKTTLATTANVNLASISGGQGGGLSAWIKDNGAESDNEIELSLLDSLMIDQDNTADVDNNVDVYAKTGKNEAEENTGGEVTIKTGDIDMTLGIDNSVNFNEANTDCGCLLGSQDFKIGTNGADTENEIEANLSSPLIVDQDNSAASGELDNYVDVMAKTGWNEVEKSTGSVDGDPVVETGDVNIDATIDNSGVNMNSLNGEPHIVLPDFEFSFDWEGFLAFFHLVG